MKVKLEIELPYDPMAPFLGVYPEKKKKKKTNLKMYAL